MREFAAQCKQLNAGHWNDCGRGHIHFSRLQPCSTLLASLHKPAPFSNYPQPLGSWLHPQSSPALPHLAAHVFHDGASAGTDALVLCCQRWVQEGRGGRLEALAALAHAPRHLHPRIAAGARLVIASKRGRARERQREKGVCLCVCLFVVALTCETEKKEEKKTETGKGGNALLVQLRSLMPFRSLQVQASNPPAPPCAFGPTCRSRSPPPPILSCTFFWLAREQ